jgi:hypothetical protein
MSVPGERMMQLQPKSDNARPTCRWSCAAARHAASDTTRAEGSSGSQRKRSGSGHPMASLALATPSVGGEHRRTGTSGSSS